MAMRTRASRPHLQPYVDAIDAYREEHKLTVRQVAEILYGRDKRGAIQSSRFSPVAKGRARPNEKTIALIKEKTGLDLSGIAPLAPVLLAPSTPAKTALVQFAAAERAPPRTPSPASTPSTARVTLAVTHATGETVLSLTDVTAEQAIKLLQSLVSSGLA